MSDNGNADRVQGALQTDARTVVSSTDEQAVDAALDGSFPASDPPPWTLGSTRDALRLPQHSQRNSTQAAGAILP